MFVFSAPTLTTPSPARTQPRRASGSLFDHLFADRAPSVDAPTRVPALDVAETDTAYVLSFEVPGVAKDQLKVSVQGRRVQLDTQDAPATAAVVEAAPAADAERVLYRERTQARYARTVVLPAEVEQAGATARVDNGVLTLRLLKKVATGATQLTIE